ncbi:MAG: squalene synthase HpnC [Methylophaga sp.]|nr:squalene synthase HpnC [Methylophaga sp.]
MTQSSARINQAYAWCQALAKSHYENFPVASILVPRRLRRAIAAIYAFARSADDFADEGDAPQVERLTKLNQYSQLLHQIDAGQYSGNDPIFIALQHAIKQFSLPVQLFEDLLIAFRQDVVKSRYTNFAEVLDYCHYSANPVGRILLYLDGNPSELQLIQSDAICSALQLINFCQDIAQDYIEQDRIYIPQDELVAAGLEEIDLLHPVTDKIAPLIRSLYQRSQDLMIQGYQLGISVQGCLGWEIKAMTLGGMTTLKLLKQQKDRDLLTRPRLDKVQLLKIIAVSACNRSYLGMATKQMKG